MATEKLFGAAGVATYKGELKARFGKDAITRIKIWREAERVNFVDLPTPSTKIQALEYLKSHPEFQDADAQFAIQTKLNEKVKAAKKGEVKVAGVKSKKVANTETAKETA